MDYVQPLKPKDDDLCNLLIKTDLVFTNYTGKNLAIPQCPSHSNFCLCSCDQVKFVLLCEQQTNCKFTHKQIY